MGRAHPIYLQQEAQSHCGLFCQSGPENIDWTYNIKPIFGRRKLSMEIVIEEFNPVPLDLSSKTEWIKNQIELLSFSVYQGSNLRNRTR